MASSRRFTYIFGFSCLLWLGVMGVLYYVHYIRHVDEELGYFSADVKFDDESRQYFSIYLDGRKIGYKNESQYDQAGFKVFSENGTIKLNLAGMSREVFIQTVSGIDSSNLVTRYMDFTIISGTHVNNFYAVVKDDSLIILVKNNPLAQWRKGVFIVDGHITLPVALPFFIHNSGSETLSMQIFDPVNFSYHLVHIGREGEEVLQINDRNYETVRYDLRFKSGNSTLWLDKNGTVVKSENFPFFSNIFGSFTVERAMDKNVFLLPLAVKYGNDLLKRLVLYPQQFISSPRELTYLEIEIQGLRAANIDISASNKEVLSYNPVIFEIHNRPVARGERLIEEMRTVAADTSVIGMSDYIQPYDSRIIRTARSIAGAENDTLKIAQLLNRWVYTNVKKEKGLDITRSIDIFRNLKGDCDEHTKLFTALSRSLGIPTQINTGLVYEDRAFRYHSWPSVFVDSVWHDLDPTFGQDYADATHIALVRGDFDKIVEILRIIHKISLKIHTYR